MDRAAFLARVRDQLGRGSYSGAHPLPTGSGVPTMAWPEDDRPLDESFLAALRRHGGDGRTVASEDAIADLLEDVVERHPIRTAVVTDEPTTVGVDAVLRGLGVEVSPFTGPAAAAVDLGVTGAVAGIARTGTVVVDTAAARGRTASLLPDVHLVLIERSRLCATPADLWRGIPRRYPDGLPSQIVLVTGPSKSADIEGQLTVGVHGPRALWVGIVGNAVAPSRRADGG